MKRWLLDTSALPTLRDDETGAQQMADLVSAALTRQAECHACFMTLMELACRVWKDEAEPPRWCGGTAALVRKPQYATSVVRTRCGEAGLAW